MFKNGLYKLVALCVSTVALAFVALPVQADGHEKAEAHDATIEFRQWRVGFILSGGIPSRGTLTVGDETYTVRVNGMRVGAIAGISRADISGEVYNLNNLEDIEGTYSAAGAGVAVIGGVKVWTLQNDKGVQLKLRGTQKGIEVALDVGGMTIRLEE